MTDIQKARILIIATDGFEQSELLVPLQKLREKGAMVEIAAPDKTRERSEIRGWRGESGKADWGDSVPVDKSLDDIDPQSYDALILPGLVATPIRTGRASSLRSSVGAILERSDCPQQRKVSSDDTPDLILIHETASFGFHPFRYSAI